MTLQPDEDDDVIVHQSRLYFEGVAQDTWTVWLGAEIQGERETLEAAIELACDVAAMHSKPASRGP